MKQLPNVIFLDFDGVICNPSTCIAVGDRGGVFSYIDPISAAFVRTLCEENNAKLVISSTWRLLYDREAIKAILGAACPRLGWYVWDDSEQWRTGSLGGLQRGKEIEAWIAANSQNFNRFVILDDNSDMEPLMDSFVKTDCYNGLDYDTFTEAKRILEVDN